MTCVVNPPGGYEPPKEMVIERFEGREWEKHGASLGHLSKES